MQTILIILVLLLLLGGGGYYYSGPTAGFGTVGFVLLVLLIVYLAKGERL